MLNYQRVNPPLFLHGKRHEKTCENHRIQAMESHVIRICEQDGAP